MTVRDIEEILEAWAPKEVAWEQDNVGLQVGSSSKRVRRILLALDISDSVLREAVQKKVDLVITHHPLIFRSLRSVTNSDRAGSLVSALVRNEIALYSAHTNLDFTRNGVSCALASALGVREVKFLSGISGSLKKVAVFVPPEHVDPVAQKMAGAGAGIIGNYECCSFRTAGTGTFRGMEGAKPFYGKLGTYETAKEVRLEMIVPRWALQQTLRAMKESHPYEEVAYDVYPLENENSSYGAGAVGDLPRPMRLRQFLVHVRRSLSANGIRYTGNLERRVHRVAVCGGSGSELLGAALEHDADVFITGDVKYHTFQEAEGNIALVDAGHYETEQVVLAAVADKLTRAIRDRRQRLSVLTTKKGTNPIHYF
ncbi:MAG: Nif3-like dinuclear metal center hexameric protein [Bacteroidota bacterium]